MTPNDTHLCCFHHVAAGEAPADWHPDCMDAYRQKRALEAAERPEPVKPSPFGAWRYSPEGIYDGSKLLHLSDLTGLLEMLKRLEWDGYNGMCCCPECLVDAPDPGKTAIHLSDCKLKGWIDKLEGKG